ncbi:sensor histidine kinase [Olleya namhaensis]|uniref:sensor histidine kinase n=1 Tax=Olleya namhaensis TaxID=1144750 RepID=UPI002491EA0E|nr:histidine kinase [Olleya namhaensis]
MKTKSIYYWSLQIIIWSLLSGVAAFSYWISGNEFKLEIWQLLLDFVALAILSILITHLLKKFINKYLEFDALKVIDGFKIMGLLFLASALLILSYTIYIRLTYTFLYDRVDVLNHASQSLKNHIILFLNYGIYFMVWTVFYVAIKGLMQLNRTREKRLELETSLKESQLNTLKGQINPHFMFNSLNNIRGLMLEDVDRARNMLTNLSETLRYSLTKSEENAILLEDELEMVENYIEISKIQFEDRLQFITNIDQASLNKQIPPMIIQMLVENALKHGISNLKKGGQVCLSTTISDNQLQIEVSNSGTLQTHEDSTKLGLKNIKRRLELLYDKSATFSLNEIDNQVVATIKMPLL